MEFNQSLFCNYITVFFIFFGIN